MCRLCGRMVRCIFDTMPSRALSRPTSNPVTFAVNGRQSVQQQTQRSLHSKNQLSQSTLVPRPSSRVFAPSIRFPLALQSTLHTTATLKADVESSLPFTSAPSATLPPSMTPSLQPTLESASITTTITAPQTIDSATRQPLVLSKSLQTLLPAIQSQKPHYITAHIHSFPYLLTEGDTLRLPFHMHGVSPGDVLRFNRATLIGSRDYTLKAGFSSPQHTSPTHVRGETFTNKRRTGEPSYIDDRLFECRMRVMGLDSGPMVITEKKKRRNRRTRRVYSKHKYTVLKVMEVRLKTLDELTTMEGEQVVLE